MQDLLIPLFPLEIVLLPDEILPLHIFEDRYKQMIAECLAKGEHAPPEAEFGIVRAQEDKLQTVGCTAGLVQVMRRYEDGRLDILTVGRRRFEILFTNQDKPYLRGAVAFFEDDDPSQPAASEIDQARSLLGEVLRRLKIADAESSAPPGKTRSASFQIAARLPLGLDLKQQLLEMRNESERLRQVTKIMERLVPALDFRDQARRKAAGNGHVKANVGPA
jgi:ATP-dependent Lon protease